MSIKTIVAIIALLMLQGCSQSSQFLKERNWRGCYIVDGKVAAPAPATALLDGQGIVLTGEMTTDDCIRIIQTFRGGLF